MKQIVTTEDRAPIRENIETTVSNIMVERRLDSKMVMVGAKVEFAALEPSLTKLCCKQISTEKLTVKREGASSSQS